MRNQIVKATVFYVLLASFGVIFGMEPKGKASNVAEQYLKTFGVGNEADCSGPLCQVNKIETITKEINGSSVPTALRVHFTNNKNYLMDHDFLNDLCRDMGENDSGKTRYFFESTAENVIPVSRDYLKEKLLDQEIIKAVKCDDNSTIQYKPTTFQSLSLSSPTPRVAKFLGYFDGYQALDGDVTSTICLFNKTDTEFSHDPRVLLELKRTDSENHSEIVAVHQIIISVLKKITEQQTAERGHMKLEKHIVSREDVLKLLESDAIKQLLIEQPAATQRESRHHREEAAVLLQTPLSVTFLDLPEEDSDDIILDQSDQADGADRSEDHSGADENGDAKTEPEDLPHIDSITGWELIQSLQNVDGSEDGSEEEATKNATEDQKDKKPELTDPIPLPEEQNQGFLDQTRESAKAIIAKVQKSAEETKKKAEGKESARTLVGALRQAVGDIKVEKYQFDGKVHTIATFNLQTSAFNDEINLVEKKVCFSEEAIKAYLKLEGMYAIIVYGAVGQIPFIVSSEKLLQAVGNSKPIDMKDEDGYRRIGSVDKVHMLADLEKVVSSPKAIGNYVVEDKTFKPFRTLFEFVNADDEQTLSSYKFDRWLEFSNGHHVIMPIDEHENSLSRLLFIVRDVDYDRACLSAKIQAAPFLVDMQYSTRKPDTNWVIIGNSIGISYLDSDSGKIICPLTFQNEKDADEIIMIKVVQDCIQGFSSEEDGYIAITYQDVFNDEQSKLTVPAKLLRETYATLAGQIDECRTRLSVKEGPAAENAGSIVRDLQQSLLKAEIAYPIMIENLTGKSLTGPTRPAGGAASMEAGKPSDPTGLRFGKSPATEAGTSTRPPVVAGASTMPEASPEKRLVPEGARKTDGAKVSPVVPGGVTVKLSDATINKLLAPSSSYSYLKIGGTVLALTAATTAFLYSFKQLPPSMMEFLDNFFAKCNLGIDNMRISWFASPSKE